MRFPRLTTRRLMVIVAIAGIAMAIHQLYSRWSFHRRWVVAATRQENWFRELMEDKQEDVRNAERMLREELDRPEETAGEAADWRSEIELSRILYEDYKDLAEWYATKKRLSRRAMTHPWESVPAMPPEPVAREWPH